MKNTVEELLLKFKGLKAEEIIKQSFDVFGDRIIFATSLGEEDQIIIDMISKVVPQMKVFTLDTGRLFQESYDLLERTQKKYPMNIKVYYPDTRSVEEMVDNKGINLFYESVENRKECCGVRKIDPLRRALEGVDVWIVGLRKSQSVTRTDMDVVEWDEGNAKVKINPLLDWSNEEMEKYIQDNGVDVNPLHKKGFISIGCASCTRAVNEGEDIRAGRWWWESPEKKECGLHNRKRR